jgi:hypothetical protein
VDLQDGLIYLATHVEEESSFMAQWKSRDILVVLLFQIQELPAAFFSLAYVPSHGIIAFSFDAVRTSTAIATAEKVWGPSPCPNRSMPSPSALIC